MTNLDFTFETREEMIRRDAREDGLEEGLERGREEGREEGQFIAYLDLVNDGIISIETAASKLGISIEDFEEKMNQMNVSIE